MADDIARYVPDRRHDVVGADSCTGSSPDVVSQARGILTAIVASDLATVEKQFTDDMKGGVAVRCVGGDLGEAAESGRCVQELRTDPRVRRIDDKEILVHR